MKCKINNWGCVYHACMSNDCQKEIMKSDDSEIENRFGKGRCFDMVEICDSPGSCTHTVEDEINPSCKNCYYNKIVSKEELKHV